MTNKNEQFITDLGEALESRQFSQESFTLFMKASRILHTIVTNKTLKLVRVEPSLKNISPVIDIIERDLDYDHEYIHEVAYEIYKSITSQALDDLIGGSDD